MSWILLAVAALRATPPQLAHDRLEGKAGRLYPDAECGQVIGILGQAVPHGGIDQLRHSGPPHSCERPAGFSRNHS